MEKIPSRQRRTSAISSLCFLPTMTVIFPNSDMYPSVSVSHVLYLNIDKRLLIWDIMKTDWSSVQRVIFRFDFLESTKNETCWESRSRKKSNTFENNEFEICALDILKLIDAWKWNIHDVSLFHDPYNDRGKMIALGIPDVLPCFFY